jgi:hypothetical protein
LLKLWTTEPMGTDDLAPGGDPTQDEVLHDEAIPSEQV